MSLKRPASREDLRHRAGHERLVLVEHEDLDRRQLARRHGRPERRVLDAGERHRDREQNQDEAGAAEDAQQVMARDDERTHVLLSERAAGELDEQVLEAGLLDRNFTHGPERRRDRHQP